MQRRISTGKQGRERGVPLPEIPTVFLWLGCWSLTAGLVYGFHRMGAKGESFRPDDPAPAPA